MNEQSLLQEIEDDLARQRVEKLWQKYGPSVLGIAVAIVLVTAAVSGLKTYRTHTAQKASAAYMAVFDKKAEKPADLMAALDQFRQESKGTIQAVFAALNQAAMAAEDGQKDKALEIYAALAADTSVEATYRQLADLMYVQTDMDSGDAAALTARLQPLWNDSPWRFMAREYAGYLAVRQGDKAKAKQIFQELKALPEVPKIIEGRSNDMLKWLNEGA